SQKTGGSHRTSFAHQEVRTGIPHRPSSRRGRASHPGRAEDYRPIPIQAKRVLRLLPNLDIVMVGPDLEPGDRLALDAYAAHKSDHIWKLQASKLLRAAEAGRSIQEIR